MMTWVTALSIFDSCANMELPQLAVAFDESESLFNELVYGVENEDLGVAPAPLRLMWTGYETALAAYAAACAVTLVQHGVNTGVRALEIANSVTALRTGGDPAPFVLPPWFADTDVLRSHRSNMMRRWPKVYSWKGVTADMPYIWPVVDDEGGYELRLSKYDKDLLAKHERHLNLKIYERISNV